jgi:tRNA (cmo5U34)-methyltransferase
MAPQVGNGIDVPSGGWTFGDQTPAAFEDHVTGSIPFYAEGHDLIVDLAAHLVPAGGRCYDLGCSTGTLSARLAELLAPRRAEVIGVDREPGMVELATERSGGLPHLHFETAALEELTLERADLVISYYTLQFLPVASRRQVLGQIRRALDRGGSLILFEKVLAPTARDQEVATGVYQDWKLRQGYSDEEIAAKARSLRGVLQPQSSADNDSMLRAAGFAEVIQVFRWMAFEGVVARVAGQA